MMATPKTCVVYVWLTDILGNLIGSGNGAQLSVTSKRGAYQDALVLPINKTVSFNSSGYAAITMIETQSCGVEVVFSISYKVGYTTKQMNFKPAIVPNSGAAALTSFASVA